MTTSVYRPASGRVLTVVVGVIGIVVAVSVAFSEGWTEAGRVLPWLALLVGGCWAVLWRPCVEVSDGGVRIVNVTRTVAVPWPAITDVEARWALTLVTAYGRRFTAWAAPSGGRAPVRRATRIHPGAIRPDADAGQVNLGGPAGDAVELVRRHWEQLRRAGHLDNPVLEHDRVPVRWHVETFLGGAALLVLGVVSFIV